MSQLEDDIEDEELDIDYMIVYHSFIDKRNLYWMDLNCILDYVKKEFNSNKI